MTSVLLYVSCFDWCSCITVYGCCFLYYYVRVEQDVHVVFNVVCGLVKLNLCVCYEYFKVPHVRMYTYVVDLVPRCNFLCGDFHILLAFGLFVLLAFRLIAMQVSCWIALVWHTYVFALPALGRKKPWLVHFLVSLVMLYRLHAPNAT